MKPTCLAWLTAGLLLLPGCVLAQAAGAGTLPPAYAPVPLAPAEGQRAELGGPPRLPVAAEPGAFTGDLARLLQVPLPAEGPDTPHLLPAEVARLFPQVVRSLPAFRADINTLATAKAVAGSRSLVLLVLPPGTAGVPSGGATPGQRLKVLAAGGEQLVAVARPAAAGSHALLVRAEAGLAGQPVAAVGLEYPAEQVIDYGALGLLSLRATQQLAQRLAIVQQQLADLHRQLAAARQLNGQLLLDHAQLLDLQQQLSVLQNRQAAIFSALPPRRLAGWSAD